MLQMLQMLPQRNATNNNALPTVRVIVSPVILKTRPLRPGVKLLNENTLIPIVNKNVQRQTSDGKTGSSLGNSTNLSPRMSIHQTTNCSVNSKEQCNPQPKPIRVLRRETVKAKGRMEQPQLPDDNKQWQVNDIEEKSTTVAENVDTPIITTERLNQTVISTKSITTTNSTKSPVHITRYADKYDLLIPKLSLSGSEKKIINDFIKSDRILYANTLSGSKKLWPKGIVHYEIGNSFKPSEMKSIYAAMEEFHRRTCIRFIAKTLEKDFIHIDKVVGCKSDVGRSRGKHVVSLAEPYCTVKGNIMHELMHVLGFIHEHQRGDRDSYININWQNLMTKEKSQFVILQSQRSNSNFTTGYDYNSIMHYERTAFTKNGYPTIEPKSEKVIIGQRNGFSPTDLFEINVLYKCLNN